MYYLQSRYYDPIVCRFINADVPDVITASPTALTDKNLFAYCDNNPVMRVDENGEFWVELGIMAVGGVVGAVTNAITSAAMQYFVKGEVDAKSVVVAAASGFVSGAIASSPLGLGGQIIAGSIVGGLSYMADAYVTETSASLDGLLFSMAAGAIGGAIGGKGLDSDYAVSNQIYSTKVVRAYSSIYYSPVDAAHATARAVITRNQIILSEAGCSGLRFLLGSAVSNFATTLYSNQFKINFGK
jgi:RHS repeat-associated protein